MENTQQDSEAAWPPRLQPNPIVPSRGWPGVCWRAYLR